MGSKQAGFFVSHLRTARQYRGVNDSHYPHQAGSNSVDGRDIRAFTELVRQHQAGLRAFIRALGVEADWVDDLAQEAFVVAWQKRERFESGKDFGRWLRGIVRHLIANERRKEARRARLLHGPLTDLLLEPAAEESSPAEIETSSLLQALNECVAQLPERSRALLRGRYEQSEDAPALAARFHQGAEAIRQSLHRIRETVKQCVERKLEAWR